MSAEVRGAVEQCERLISAPLTLARNDLAQLSATPLDLATLAEDALEARPPTGLTILGAFHEAPVAGDPVLLEHLVNNLLDNAERYNVPGGTVSISTGTADDAAFLRVADTGPVVLEDQIERLFLPFTRLEDRTRHEGFGLGLALVSSIATVHHGTVHASPISTGGLELTVDLPRHECT